MEPLTEALCSLDVRRSSCTKAGYPLLMLRRSGTCTCSAIIPDVARALDDGVCTNGQSATSVGLYLTNAGEPPSRPAAQPPSRPAARQPARLVPGGSPGSPARRARPTSSPAAHALPPLRLQPTSPPPASSPRSPSPVPTTPGTCPPGPRTAPPRRPPRTRPPSDWTPRPRAAGWTRWATAWRTVRSAARWC
jgi:hypothetical protein